MTFGLPKVVCRVSSPLSFSSVAKKVREMLKCMSEAVRATALGFRAVASLPRQLFGISPFDGDVRPTRIPVFGIGSSRPTLPFPHPWNYEQPLRILESCFWGADAEIGDGRHTRYLDLPGLPPVLISRDPRIVRCVATETGDREGNFDRDTILAGGIAHGTGKDMLLYANGAAWRRQRKLASSPFGKTTLFQPEQFREFEEAFRRTIRRRLSALNEHVERFGAPARVRLEPEIKPVMLELLVNGFFGAEVPYEQLRAVYVPAIERVIDQMIVDTVVNFGIPFRALPPLTRRIRQARDAYALFDKLADLVLAARPAGRGLWKHFKSDAPSDALRSNIRLILAGALEATTSYASWALAHLARSPAAQERLFNELGGIHAYTPETLENAGYFGHVLDETLRLTPPLYFLPRKATADTWLQTTAERRLLVPKGAYLLLDIWHANRHEDHWGASATGYPAIDFVPERWQWLADHGRASKEFLHFAFGHGPRVCPGKFLGQLEVSLVVGAFVKLFRFRAVHSDNLASAGISTKPADGVLVELELRENARPFAAPIADNRIS